MQARAKKGVCSNQQYYYFNSYIEQQLLSEEEKVILASELAAIDKRDSECVIM